MFDIPFLKRLVVLNGIVPLAILGWDAWNDRLGANSVNYAIHITGMMALLFLVVSLAVTPLKAITGWQTLIAYRRALGLYGFFYAVIHTFLYVTFDRAGNLSSTLDEFASRRYLQVGLASLILMVPLAVTSTDAMIRRLGPKRWKLLHRLAYVAIALGGLHYLLLVKSDIRQPLAFLATIGSLLVFRFGTSYIEKSRRLTKSNSKLTATQSSKATAVPARARFWKGRLKLAKIFQETSDVRTFRFVAPDGGRLPFNFEPGQYLNLKFDIDGQFVARSYTIASSPTRRDYCEITVKREPNGRGSRYIHDTWREGDLIEIGAPAGKFFFTGQDVDEVVLIAGGVGITPVMSMLRYLTDRGWPGTIYFVFVIKSNADYIFREELEYLQKRFSNLRLFVTLTRPSTSDTRLGLVETGRLSVPKLLHWIPNLPSLAVYMCGPNAMMDHTRELLIAAGVPAIAVHTELFSSTVTTPHAEALASNAKEAADDVLTVGTNDESIYNLVVSGLEARLEIESSESVLEGAERHGVEIPYECRSGVCGQCKIRLCRGRVRMDSEIALATKEREQGWILACQSHLQSDAEIAIA